MRYAYFTNDRQFTACPQIVVRQRDTADVEAITFDVINSTFDPHGDPGEFGLTHEQAREVTAGVRAAVTRAIASPGTVQHYEAPDYDSDRPGCHTHAAGVVVLPEDVPGNLLVLRGQQDRCDALICWLAHAPVRSIHVTVGESSRRVKVDPAATAAVAWALGEVNHPPGVSGYLAQIPENLPVVVEAVASPGVQTGRGMSDSGELDDRAGGDVDEFNDSFCCALLVPPGWSTPEDN